MLKRAVLVGPMVLLLVLAFAQSHEPHYDENTMQLLRAYRDEASRLAEALEAREKVIAELKGQIRVARLKVRKTEEALAALQEAMPTSEQVFAEVRAATATHAGLRRETKRILGDMGITHIVIGD